jgi:hypothetical protein
MADGVLEMRLVVAAPDYDEALRFYRDASRSKPGRGRHAAAPSRAGRQPRRAYQRIGARRPGWWSASNRVSSGISLWAPRWYVEGAQARPAVDQRQRGPQHLVEQLPLVLEARADPRVRLRLQLRDRLVADREGRGVGHGHPWHVLVRTGRDHELG